MKKVRSRATPRSARRKVVRPQPGALYWNPRVACRTVESTAFILLDSRMVRLNEVGTRVWELFELGSTVERVVDEVVAEYDTDAAAAARDAARFVRELVQRKMLVSIES